MIKPMLYDVVENLYPIEAANLPAGERGTLVDQYADDIFEVEFMNDDGETIALSTLSRNQFIVVWQSETEQEISLSEQVAQIVSLLPPQVGTEVLDFARFLSVRRSEKTMPTSVAT